MGVPGTVGVPSLDILFKAEGGSRGRDVRIQIAAMHIPGNPVVSFNTIKCIIQQTFSPKWSEEQAYGKMDPIATYSHTGRSLKFDFTVFAKDFNEAEELSGQIDKFIRFNYPSYNLAGTALKAPPFFAVSFMAGNYIPNLQGYITNLNIYPGTSKEKGTSEGKTKKGLTIAERYWQLDFQLKVLHEVTPGWTGSSFLTKDGSFAYVAGALRGQQSIPSAAELAARDANRSVMPDPPGTHRGQTMADPKTHPTPAPVSVIVKDRNADVRKAKRMIDKNRP